MRWLARAGLAARGVMYVVIGWIAVEVAFHRSNQQADRTGALHAISATPVGGVLLWLLVIGFIGMALWRLSEALYGSPGSGGQKASKRLAALGRAIIYAVIAYGVLKYALGAGGPQSSDKQSVDLTATLLKYPGGQILVIVIGLALIGGGIYLAYEAWKEKFRRDLELGQMRARTRRIVEWLGKFGGVARGAVFVTAGIFLVVAAVEAKPQQAKGIDSSLRALASTPLGPWLLVLVAIGLIMFGVFSCCQAKWQRLVAQWPLAQNPLSRLGGFDDEAELGGLLVVGQRVAFHGGGEAALAGQADLLQRHVLGRLVDPALQVVLGVQLRPLGGDQPQHHLLAPGRAAAARTRPTARRPCPRHRPRRMPASRPRRSRPAACAS